MGDVTATPSDDDLKQLRRIREVCAEIKVDMERDVAEFDGRPMDGRVVAEIHGTLAATVSALAGMVSILTGVVEAQAAPICRVCGGTACGGGCEHQETLAAAGWPDDFEDEDHS